MQDGVTKVSRAEFLAEMKDEIDAKAGAKALAASVFGDPTTKQSVFNFCRGGSSKQVLFASIFGSFAGGGAVGLGDVWGFDAVRYRWFQALVAMYVYGFQRELLTEEEQLEAQRWAE